jgi:hypothetical protein
MLQAALIALELRSLREERRGASWIGRKIELESFGKEPQQR